MFGQKSKHTCTGTVVNHLRFSFFILLHHAPQCASGNIKQIFPAICRSYRSMPWNRPLHYLWVCLFVQTASELTTYWRLPLSPQAAFYPKACLGPVWVKPYTLHTPNCLGTWPHLCVYFLLLMRTDVEFYSIKWGPVGKLRISICWLVGKVKNWS